MPAEPTQRFGPMVTIQQYYAEASPMTARSPPDSTDVRWSTSVNGVTRQATGNGDGRDQRRWQNPSLKPTG